MCVSVDLCARICVARLHLSRASLNPSGLVSLSRFSVVQARDSTQMTFLREGKKSRFRSGWKKRKGKRDIRQLTRRAHGGGGRKTFR
jgi:hypothetical protein